MRRDWDYGMLSFGIKKRQDKKSQKKIPNTFIGHSEDVKNTLELYPKTVAHTSKGDDIAAQTTRKFKADMAKIMQWLKTEVSLCKDFKGLLTIICVS